MLGHYPELHSVPDGLQFPLDFNHLLIFETDGTQSPSINISTEAPEP
jgi:hypothetical protein